MKETDVLVEIAEFCMAVIRLDRDVGYSLYFAKRGRELVRDLSPEARDWIAATRLLAQAAQTETERRREPQ